jgi:Domain of unknown function (DUF397)
VAGPDGVRWRTSSFSGGNGECVEVGASTLDGVLVRDSKHPDAGTITFTAEQWRAFVAGVNHGLV